MCLRCLIMVLFCKIHDLSVHCDSLVQSRCHGVPEGGSLKSPPPPTPSLRQKIVFDKLNEFEGSKMMCEDVFFLSVPF